MKKHTLKSLLAGALLGLGLGAGQAAVITVDSALTTATGTITFAAGETFGPVTFGSFFNGQSLGGVGGCTDVTITNCVVGSPTGALSLATGTGLTPTALVDSSNPNNPTDPTAPPNLVLAGSNNIIAGDPIAMLFGGGGLSAVSFSAGGFNAVGTTLIQVFSSTGVTSILNPRGGGEFLNFLVRGTGDELITGILISLVAFEQNGFAIDNVSYLVPTTTSGTPSTGTPSTGTPSTGTPSTGTPSTGTPIPAPNSLALVGLALLAVGFMRRRRA